MNDWREQLQRKADDLDLKRRRPSAELLGAGRHYLATVKRLADVMQANNPRRPTKEQFTDHELNLAEQLVAALNRFRGLCDLEGWLEDELFEQFAREVDPDGDVHTGLVRAAQGIADDDRKGTKR